MGSEQARVSEAIQKQAVKVLATNPAGEGLCLIGGFRYRLLDASCRRSLDIDYHWAGELEAKQAEIVRLFRNPPPLQTGNRNAGRPDRVRVCPAADLSV